jgi:hypothetical protein
MSGTVYISREMIIKHVVGDDGVTKRKNRRKLDDQEK